MHTYNIHNMHGGVSLIPGHLLSIMMIFFCPIKNHAHIKGFKSSYALWVCLTEKRLKKVIYYLFMIVFLSTLSRTPN